MAVSELNKFGYAIPQRMVDFQPIQLTKERHREVSRFADEVGLKIYQAAHMLIEIGLQNFDVNSLRFSELEAKEAELQAQLEEIQKAKANL